MRVEIIGGDDEGTPEDDGGALPVTGLPGVLLDAGGLVVFDETGITVLLLVEGGGGGLAVTVIV